MKRMYVAMALVASIALASSVGMAGDQAWFSEDCAMCTNLMSVPGLMENVEWDQYALQKGVVCVTSVSEKYLAQYRTAHARMGETGMKLMQGEKMELCGSCTALGACMMKGVSQEYVETSNGDIWILTSDNAEVVTDLHEWVQKNKAEMAKHSHG